MSFLKRFRHLFGTDPADHGGTANTPKMISCEEALAVIYEFIDGELDDVASEQVMAHFDMCAHCYPQLQLEKSFLTAVQKAASGEKAPPELKTKLLGLLEEAGKG